MPEGRWVRKNKNHLVIDKLYKNVPVTTKELELLEEFLMQEAESKDRLFTEYEEQPLGKFVRKIIGLDIEAAQKHFATFIQQANLNANQITFIQKIIDFHNSHSIDELKNIQLQNRTLALNTLNRQNYFISISKISQNKYEF